MHSLFLHLDRPLLAVRIKPPSGELGTDSSLSDTDREWAKYDSGYHEKAVALQKVERVCSEIKSALVQHIATQQEELARCREASVQLAVAIAQGIVGQVVSQSSDRLTQLIRDAVNEIQPQVPVTVQLNPQDKARIAELPADYWGPDIPLTWVGDNATPVGCCQLSAGPVTLVNDYRQTLAEIEQKLPEVWSCD